MKTFSFLAIASVLFLYSCKKEDYNPIPSEFSFSIVSQGTTQKSYIKLGSTGVENGSKTQLRVVSPVNGNIDGLIFTTKGKGIKSITCNGTTAPFILGKAVLSRDIAIKKGENNLFYSVSYNPLRSLKSSERNAPASNDTNSVTLEAVIVKNKIVNVGLKSPTMIMVNSGPSSIAVRDGLESLILPRGVYPGIYGDKFNFAIIEVEVDTKGTCILRRIPLKIFEGNCKIIESVVFDHNSIQLNATLTEEIEGIRYLVFEGGYGARTGLNKFQLVTQKLQIGIPNDDDGAKVQIGTYLIPENRLEWSDGNSSVIQKGNDFTFGPTLNWGVLTTGQFIR